jgi:hypothetical protein
VSLYKEGFLTRVVQYWLGKEGTWDGLMSGKYVWCKIGL